jgi:hypothetical protein
MSNGFKIFMMLFPWLVVALVVWFPYSPIGRQAREHEQMQVAFPAIHAAVVRDPKFAEVRLSPSPYDGAVWISGAVASDADLNELDELMKSMSPPVTAWRGEVRIRRETTNP